MTISLTGYVFYRVLSGNACLVQGLLQALAVESMMILMLSRMDLQEASVKSRCPRTHKLYFCCCHLQLHLIKGRAKRRHSAFLLRQLRHRWNHVSPWQQRFYVNWQTTTKGREEWLGLPFLRVLSPPNPSVLLLHWSWNSSVQGCSWQAYTASLQSLNEFVVQSSWNLWVSDYKTWLANGRSHEDSKVNDTQRVSRGCTCGLSWCDWINVIWMFWVVHS